MASMLDPQSSILKTLTWLLFGVARAAESGVIVSAVRGDSPAIGSCDVFNVHIISAAANHFQPCAGERGVDFVAWVILEVARGPLPHVAAHIERAEGTAPESVASGFKDPPLFPLPGVRQIRSPFLSPWVDATVSP